MSTYTVLIYEHVLFVQYKKIMLLDKERMEVIREDFIEQACSVHLCHLAEFSHRCVGAISVLWYQ